MKTSLFMCSNKWSFI